METMELTVQGHRYDGQLLRHEGGGVKVGTGAECTTYVELDRDGYVRPVCPGCGWAGERFASAEKASDEGLAHERSGR